ncbi:MAG TPA: hypothetical protein VF245_02445 [Solirubrobacterales bacterium]
MGSNRAHDAEDQQAGWAAVNRLGCRSNLYTVLLQESKGRPLIDLIACPSRDLPKDHHVNIFKFLYVSQHLFEGFTPQHRAAGHAWLNVLPHHFRT